MSYQILVRELKQGVLRNLYLFYGPEVYLSQFYAKELERLIVDPIVKDISYNLFEGKPDVAAIYDACFAYPMFGDKRLVVVKDSGLLKAGADSSQGSRRRRAASGGSGRKRGSAQLDAKTGAAGGKLDTGAAGGKLNTGAADGMLDTGVASGKLNAGVAGGKPDAGVAGGKFGAGGDAMSLSALIDELPDFTCLLILEKEIDKRLSLLKQIGEKGLVVEFAYRSPVELGNWVRTIAGRDGKQLTRDALNLFMENGGESMSEIKGELDKLLMYTADKTGITAGDVADVCHFPLKAKIFGLIDQILAGNKKQAMSELDLLLRDREPAMKILSTLSNHFILLRQIKGLAGDGVKLSEATALMGLNPYRAERLWRQCARVEYANLTRAVELCGEQDTAIKSGMFNDVAALEYLVAGISI